MPEKTVMIFGAGATKACGGPLTNELLPEAMTGDVVNREDMLVLLHEFLKDYFRLPQDLHGVPPSAYPSLPLLLSLLDRALDRDEQMGRWSARELRKVRGALEYAVFAVIEAKLRRLQANHYKALMRPFYERGVEPTAISLNYDIILDNTMISLGDGLSLPDYCCDIATERYRQSDHFGRLIKIHGSLNWLYCPLCRRLELYFSGAGGGTSKALDELYHQQPIDDAYSCQGTPCRRDGCQGTVDPVMITPTHMKDYRNPHISRVWYRAEEALRDAERVVIIGYSMPWDDVDVVYLLKRGLEHLDADRITVVEWAPDPVGPEEHDAGRRYMAMFGGGIDWQPWGFDGWLARHGGEPIEV
jgi:hypothetical protein